MDALTERDARSWDQIKPILTHLVETNHAAKAEAEWTINTVNLICAEFAKRLVMPVEFSRNDLAAHFGKSPDWMRNVIKRVQKAQRQSFVIRRGAHGIIYSAAILKPIADLFGYETLG